MLRLFRDIAIFRRGPADLPVSGGWLLTSIVLLSVIALLIDAVLPPLPIEQGLEDHSVAILAIDAITYLLWGGLILKLASKPERFLQLMTGVFGIQLVMQPFLLPASWLYLYVGKESTWAFASQLLAMALGIWLLVALARALRAATEWPVFACVLLVMAQQIAARAIAFALFPDMLEMLEKSS